RLAHRRLRRDKERIASRREGGDVRRLRSGGQRKSSRDGKVRLFDVLSSQRRFIYLMTALLSAGGIWAALRIPSAIYPELVFPRVIVVAEGSSLDARQMVFSVTRPIEEAVSVVPGVTRV